MTFCRLEVDACKNDNATPHDRPDIETRLLRCLRIWRDDPKVVVADNRTVVQEICGLLEWYICECIPYGPDNLRGWWSDGVIHLEIANPITDRFKLLGVTWIDCHGIAPFEIDVECDPQNDTHFAKTVFRIGMLDDQQRPLICHRKLLPTRVLENRPRYNRDWAMAVELTPLLHNTTEQSDQREPE